MGEQCQISLLIHQQKKNQRKRFRSENIENTGLVQEELLSMKKIQFSFKFLFESLVIGQKRHPMLK